MALRHFLVIALAALLAGPADLAAHAAVMSILLNLTSRFFSLHSRFLGLHSRFLGLRSRFLSQTGSLHA